MSRNSNDCDVVSRALQGDNCAFRALLTERFPRLCRVVRRRIPSDLRGRIEAEDVVQIAFVNVVRHLDSFKPQGDGSFDRWLTAVVWHALQNTIHHHRTAKRGGRTHISTVFSDSTAFPPFPNGKADSTPSRIVARQEAIKSMRDAIAMLPPDNQEALLRVHIEGQPVAVVAETMGRSIRAVHGLCARGRDRLRRLLRSGSRFLSSAG